MASSKGNETQHRGVRAADVSPAQRDSELARCVGAMSIKEEQHDEPGLHGAPAVSGEGLLCAVELHRTLNKGYGMFAKDCITRGTCIVQESAIFILPPRLNNQSLPAAAATYTSDMINQLTPQHQGAYRTLHYNQAAAEKYTKDLTIFLANSVRMGVDAQHGTGVFESYSRINHSCKPNVYNSYNFSLEKLTVYAVCDISAGDEITTSYIDLLCTPEQRAKMLLRDWKFRCECGACQGPGAAASRRFRERMCDVAESIDTLESNDLFMAAFLPPRQTTSESRAAVLSLAEELVALCIADGILTMQLAHAYRECSKYSLRLGDDQLGKAIAYAQKELEIEIVCAGENYTQDSAKDWLATLQAKRDGMRKVQGEQARKDQETAKQIADKAAYDVGKKAVKKNKRVIRAVAKMATVQDEAEKLMEALSPESIEALAGKLRNKTDVAEVRVIIQEEMKNLKTDGQSKEDELRSFE